MLVSSFISVLSIASVAYAQAKAAPAAALKASFSRSAVCKGSRDGVCTPPPLEGFSASISLNVLSADLSGCNTCWSLTSPSAPKNITVLVDRGCYDEGNALCSTLGGGAAATAANSQGANVHFELCDESGASAAFFAKNAAASVLGTATKVDCGTWTGKRVDGSDAVGELVSGTWG